MIKLKEVQKLKDIENILIEYDPVKLIIMGAPNNEYSNEAKLIANQLNDSYSIEDIHKIVYDVFMSQFGDTSDQAIKIIGSFDNYREISEKIKNLI